MPTPFGAYVLLRKLADGGMAEIFLGAPAGREGELLVVKRMLPQLVDRPDLVELFLAEARVLGRLCHPNVVRLHEQGRVGAAPYMVLEYLAGEDLAELVSRAEQLGRAPLPLGCVLRIVGDVAAGLHAAHTATDEAGDPLVIVHRDVSPHNVMVTPRGEVKLLDFGIARTVSLGSEAQDAPLKGKYAYMSPEQVRGEPVDPRSDVFGTGVMLWELVTGKRLFKRDSEPSTMRAVVENPAPPASAFRHGLPAGLDDILERALAKDRHVRTPTSARLAEELEELGGAAGLDMSRATLGELVSSLLAGWRKA